MNNTNTQHLTNESNVSHDNCSTAQNQSPSLFVVTPGTILFTSAPLTDLQKHKISAAIPRILAQANAAECIPKPLNHGNPWTKDDDRQLTGLLKAKIPIPEIGKHFGRTTSAIFCRGQHLGVLELQLAA